MSALALDIEYLRSFKVFKMALFDWVATLVIAVVVARTFHWRLVVVFTFLVSVAIVTHRLLNVNTQLNAYLGLNEAVR
jgi:hypothetical protein